jgi:ABC-type histidine transport system ATPase subunit
MGSTFVEPDSGKGNLELKLDGDVVCIYGTPAGLRKLADLCMWLVEDPNQGHIHLEDHRILTDESMKGALAIFDTAKGRSGEMDG